MPTASTSPEAFLRESEAQITHPSPAGYRHGAARPFKPKPRPSVLSDGSVPRWRPGERLDDVIEQACLRHADRTAVALDDADVSYRELDARANQMARYFLGSGVRPGDRVAVLLERGLDAYVALFALLKVRAAYVPIDANHPPERLGYILEDSQATAAVVHVRFADRFPDSLPLITLDDARAEIAQGADTPMRDDERAGAADALCYVLYTSGTTGHPKGVAVAHPSICNFVRVATELYGFTAGDRVYQGMSIAFDFSIEELWVPLVVGATLVPHASATNLFGEELAAFLESRAITCFCCVPTLLASIERDLPALRVLLIGGEACPPALVKRWSRRGRELLNSYGPTETTVTATLGRMRPEKPVTIGRPLPTYSVVILDPKRAEALPIGETGEIGIAGVGLAEGYLNRPDLTAAKFIADFLGLPNNPSKRLYRTGDLGRINAEGEIEYLGRIDTQVKLRGYRIELTEIESVLLDIPDIAQTVVTTFEPEPGAPELVAYYSVKHGAPAPEPTAIAACLRSRLPAYMIPVYLERLPFIPTLVSDKADREKLPAPKTRPVRMSDTQAAPETATERLLCDALSACLGLDSVSIDGDIFKDYAAHSLLMARFCAKIRQASPNHQVAMRDIYAHTTVRKLAAALDAARPLAPLAEEAETLAAPLAAPSALAYGLTGAAQLAFYLLAGVLGIAALQASFAWTYAVAAQPWALAGRAELVTSAWFFGLNGLAIAAKWTLIGRARATTIPLWSPAYVRFWVARQVIGAAPAFAFVGTPLYNVFLRCLGARIGARAMIATTSVPIAADLFCVGEDAVIAKRVLAPGYGAGGNALHLGAIRIGEAAYVGQASVLDIATSIGDFGQLGHVSSLQRGQSVPRGKRYHGSPAEETSTNFRLNDDFETGRGRRLLFSAGQLFVWIVVLGPVADAAATYLLALWAAHRDVQALAAAPLATLSALLPVALAASLALFVGAIAASLGAIYAVPRIAQLFLREGGLHPLYGLHHFLQRAVEGFANSTFFNLLCGDSVYIETFLRFAGVKIARWDSTGSNFGTEQRFENPFLCTIGPGTVASDGLTMGNVSMSSHAFRLGACRVGANNFLGTDVFVPPNARTGDNCMLGTKVMAPIDGPMRENVGLLGSPCFEIPRAAARDLAFVGRLDEDDRRARIAAKTAHNLRTALAMLAMHWLQDFLALFVMIGAVEIYGWRDLSAMSVAVALVLGLVGALHILVERGSIGFQRLQPTIATTYDPAFWRIERYWKLSGAGSVTSLFAGTPFRPMLLRALGVKVGRRVFDDGCNISERTLVEIGDAAMLNQGVMLQAHSLEEGVFKSDVIRIGAHCGLGVGAFVHYGVTMQEGARLDPDSFLMKGESAPAHSRWRGNPARMTARVRGSTCDQP